MWEAKGTVITGASAEHGIGWARQLNPEADMVVVDGGQFWILGMKTEGRARHIVATGGAKVELLGGVAYQSWKNQKLDPPMFTVKDAEASFPIGFYPLQPALHDDRGGDPRRPAEDPHAQGSEGLPPGALPRGRQVNLARSWETLSEHPGTGPFVSFESAVGGILKVSHAPGVRRTSGVPEPDSRSCGVRGKS